MWPVAIVAAEHIDVATQVLNPGDIFSPSPTRGVFISIFFVIITI